MTKPLDAPPSSHRPGGCVGPEAIGVPRRVGQVVIGALCARMVDAHLERRDIAETAQTMNSSLKKLKESCHDALEVRNAQPTHARGSTAAAPWLMCARGSWSAPAGRAAGGPTTPAPPPLRPRATCRPTAWGSRQTGLCGQGRGNALPGSALAMQPGYMGGQAGPQGLTSGQRLTKRATLLSANAV